MSHSVFSIGNPRPDFVMCGVPRPEGGVRLIASDRLSYAELRAEWTRQDTFWDTIGIAPVAAITTNFDLILTCHMGHLIIIDAPDYPTAFEHLFKQWSPQRQRTGIDQGQPAIEPPNKAIERLCQASWTG